MVELFYKNYVLDIPKDVYYPSDDTYLLLNTLEKELKNKKFKSSLEIGTGNGLLSLSIYDQVTDLTLVDININVIHHIIGIKKKYNLNKINIIQSNLFEKISKKYDLIIFNPPYVPSESFDDLTTDGGKEGSEIIFKFLNKLYDFLEDNGVCYLLISSLNNKNKIFKKIKENNLEYKILNSKRIFFEDLITLKIKKTR